MVKASKCHRKETDKHTFGGGCPNAKEISAGIDKKKAAGIEMPNTC